METGLVTTGAKHAPEIKLTHQTQRSVWEINEEQKSSSDSMP